jgi:hypothetical protein
VKTQGTKQDERKKIDLAPRLYQNYCP